LSRACVSSRFTPWVGENAIDIVGFDFGPLVDATRAGEAGAGPEPRIAPALRPAFRVRVQKHWQGENVDAGPHAEFLDDLARGLIERDVFRTLLGPSHPTHGTHFHFDMAPWSYVRL
jgi:hypothetical protein